MHDLITIGSATRDVFLMSSVLHPHRSKDALAHIEACFPFGAKINVEEICFTTGGGATNTAVTFSRLGKFKTAALFRLGHDSAGQDVLADLKKDRIDTQFVQMASRVDEHTAYSTILSPGGEVGERTILVYRGASRHFEHKKISWPKLQAKWFYVSSLGGDLLLLKKLLRQAKKIGAQVAWNPGGQELSQLSSPLEVRRGWEGLRQSLTFFILNREEASRFTGEEFSDTRGLLRALSSFAPTAVMTDGPKGAYAMVHDLRSAVQGFYVPAVGHKPKNLTGAGDAFGAGFVVGWIKSGGDLIESLRLASFNADSVVQHIGAKAGILSSYPSAKHLGALKVKRIKL